MGTRGDHIRKSGHTEGGSVPMCRFLKKPFPQCYCMNISGRNIHNLLTFCAEDYASCRIYRSMTEQQAVVPAA